jgi:ATP-dependent RNA helicase SUPV3L1/SUV3
LSDRRISLEKLGKHLRISKEDALDFMSRAGLKRSANSKGFIGWPTDEFKTYMATMPAADKEALYSSRRSYEQLIEVQKTNEVLQHPTSLVDYQQVSNMLGIPADKTEAFLRRNNILYYQAEDGLLYLKVDILELKNNPTHYQALEIKRLRARRESHKHMTNARLAKMFDVPTEVVTNLKKKLQLTGINPLIESIVIDAMKHEAFEGKRLQALKAHSRSPLNQKTDEELDPKFISRYAIPSVLKITGEELNDAIKANLLPQDHKGRFLKEEIASVNIEKLKQALKESRTTHVVLPFHLKEGTGAATESPLDKKLFEAVNIVIPQRLTAPLNSIIYLGPTNSGKTYSSLEALFAQYEANPEGKYVYAGPLRMLAFEVYEKMAERYGEENVGFLTGEEQLNPEAPLIAATVEMAPASGTALVLDEAHWFTDVSRGYHWTNLLAGGQYETLHVLAAGEAQDTLMELLSDSATLEIKTFTRKTKISYGGSMHVSEIPERTAVVAFSRKNVYAIAEIIESFGIKVGVLYGALPLAARKNQIEKFVNGEYSVIVTTDVIGHGINLPVDNVVFAETDKYDGTERRELRIWEAAQIAGRAGRFGLSAEGKVYGLAGVDWISLNNTIIQNAAKAAMGAIGTGMIADKAIIAPAFGDLNIMHTTELASALDCWQSKAEAVIGVQAFRPSPLLEVSAKMKLIAGTLGLPLYENSSERQAPTFSNLSLITGEKVATPFKRAWNVSPADLWQIVNGPFDIKMETLKTLAVWLQEQKMTNAIERLFSVHVEGAETFYENIEQLETAARLVSELRMVNVIFKDETYVLNEELEFCEKNICDEIISILNKGLTQNASGFCGECNEPCPPWFTFCVKCFTQKNDDRNQIKA